MKNRKSPILAVSLAGILTLEGTGGAFCQTAFAGAPSADIDETMYVNLDYYGNKDKVNVVKGCSLNGQTTITDYGYYQNIVNMSGEEVPVQEDGKITWTLPEGKTGRFYYQCTLDNDETPLPWTFDVSYKKNGVPAKAEELAGASGTVEIHIKAMPDEKANLYYQNNMMLVVAVTADLSECYSIEADGAQMQNLGDTTAAVFTALPGEEGDYTVRIGTDSFETDGVFMAMAPGTVEDLEHIKDLKEAKDTWQDAGDALYDSLEAMAQSVEDMREGIGQVQSGLSSAETARGKWSESKDAILAGNDRTLQALGEMSGRLETMVPHLQTAKDTAETVHRSADAIMTTLNEMQEPLRKMYTRLKGMESSSEGIAQILPDIRDDMEFLIQTDASFQVETGTALEQIALLLENLEAAGMDYYDFEYEEEEEESTDVSEDETLESEAVWPSESDTESEESSEADLSETEETSSETDTGETEEKQDSTDSTPVAQIEKKQAPFVGAGNSDLAQKMQMLKKISEDSKALTLSMKNLLEDVSESAGYGAELTDEMDLMIEDLTALKDSLDAYYPDLQAFLDDSSALVEQTAKALDEAVATLGIVQNTLKDTSGELDTAARDSLQGSMALLDKSLGVLDSTAKIRQAGRTMKDVMDEQLDKFDTENRFLFMDPSAEKVSFTSEKNKPPRTLQVVLRTEEISLEDTEQKELDAEKEKEEVSPLRRMWNVLVKMWNAIIDIFKNR